MQKYLMPSLASDFRRRLLFLPIRGIRTLFCLLAALLCLCNACAVEDEAEKVKRLIAEIKANGEPISAKEIKSRVPLRQGLENVTHLWMQGFAAIDKPAFHSAKGTLAFVGVPKKGFEPIVGQPWPTLDRAAKFLEKHNGALKLFHEAARRRGQSRFPAFEADPLYPKLDWQKQAGEAIKLLQLEFEVKTRKKDFRGAANSLLTLLCLTYTDPMHPQFSDLIIGDGIPVVDLLQRGEFTEEELKKFQAIIRDYSPQSGLHDYLLSSRAQLLDVLKETENGLDKLDDTVREGFYARFAVRLEHFNRVIEAMKGPRHKWLPELARAQDETTKSVQQVVQRFPQPSGSLMDLLFLGGMESPLKNITGAAYLYEYFQLADVWIAVELYRRANGDLPDSIEVLVPDYLHVIPVGPVGDKPLILEASEKGFTLKRVGMAQGDEGLFFPTK